MMHESRHAFLVMFIVCFLVFLEHGSTVLHEIHATLPVVSTNIFELEEMLIITGLNGFLGSTDVTRIRMLSCAV